MSPIGRSGKGASATPKRRRRRRPFPALAMILMLCTLAGAVWWQVLSKAEPASSATSSDRAACGPGASLPQPKAVQVRVYNATERVGLARSMSGELKKRGFTVVGMANDPISSVRPLQGVAEIRHGSLGYGDALLLSTYFPGSTLLPDGRADGSVDIALGPKFTKMADTKTVQAGAPKALADLRAETTC